LIFSLESASDVVLGISCLFFIEDFAMAGLLPKRRMRQEIGRTETRLLQKHDAYFEAWLRNAEGQERKQKQTQPSKAFAAKAAKTHR
jgi:hypothetical protein